MSLVRWDSPLGIIVIFLFSITVVLYLIAILKTERHLSYPDKTALVEERKQTLLKLKHSIESRMKATRPLITKSERLPLNQYWDKYLKNAFPYIITRKNPQKPVKIINDLVNRGFVLNNLYYQELKESDPNYNQIVDNYNINNSKIDKWALKVLEPKLNWLWRLEHYTSSTLICATLSMSNKRVPNVPIGYRLGLFGKKRSRDNIQNCLTEIESKISELLRGEDL